MWNWVRHRKGPEAPSDQVKEARDALATADDTVRSAKRATREIIDPAVHRLRRVASENNFAPTIKKALGGG